MRGPALTATLRPGTDADDYAALIAGCWREYPGVVFDLDAELPELRAFATHVAQAGGALWVAGAEKNLDGMVSVAPERGGVWEIHRMYVAAARRGTGLAGQLLAAAEAHAWAAGAARITLFSDTRFARAHRFYEKHGFVRVGPTRALHDLSATVEFGYEKSRENS